MTLFSDVDVEAASAGMENHDSGQLCSHARRETREAEETVTPCEDRSLSLLLRLQSIINASFLSCISFLYAIRPLVRKRSCSQWVLFYLKRYQSAYCFINPSIIHRVVSY
jgi:hypothetical protein